MDYKKEDGRPAEVLAEYNGERKWVQTVTFSLPSMGVFLGQTHTDYIYDVGDIIKTKHGNIKILDRRRTKKKREYYCECLTCHDIRWRPEDDLKHKYICGICAGQQCKAGYNDITVRARWMIPYFQNGESEACMYTPGSGQKVFFKCPYCGRISTKAIQVYQLYNKHSINCICERKWPYGESYLGIVLEQNGISYKHDVKTNWSNDKRYDFIIEDYKIVIEVDGEFGHGYEREWKTEKDILKEKDLDKFKTKMAIDNGYKIFRINYYRDKKELLKDEICNNLPEFIWKNTNWETVQLDMCKGVRFNICQDYEKTDKTMRAIDELCNKYNYSISSIRKFLKEGNEYGWCIYPKHKYKKRDMDDVEKI